jgi:hypothetical protein
MKAVIIRFPFNVSDIPLASLVPEIANPHQNALQLNRRLNESDLSVREVDNYQGQLFDSKHTFLRAKLTQFVSLFTSSWQADGLDLVSPKGKIYQLKQPNSVFQELCAQLQDDDQTTVSQDDGQRISAAEQKPSVQKQRLEKKYKAGLSEYFITGYCTFLNANMDTWDEQNDAKTGSAEVPVGKIVNGASQGAAGKLAEPLNASLEGGKEEGSSGRSSLLAPGERIFAVSYERVKFKLFKRGDMSAAVNNGTTQWIMINQTRGISPDDTHNAVSIELGLEDLNEEEDELEPVGLDPGCEVNFLAYVGDP